MDLLHGAAWRLSDDTQLTLATCESIVEHGSTDPALIAASLLRWYRSRRLTGLGASTLKALRDLDAGSHWAMAGRKGERAAGNGAAMRVAPLAFCTNPQDEDSRRLIRDICRITHHSDEAYGGGLAVVIATNAAFRGDQPLAWIAAQLPDTVVRERLLEYADLPPAESIAAAAGRYGASGYVAESVPLALFAASRLRDLGFTSMLEQVIAAGGDTDTNAAIAGQIAGASLGFSGLPSEFLARLPQPDLVISIAKAFAQSVTGSFNCGNVDD